MQRKGPRKSGTRQRAVLLPLETFLALTDMPASQRQGRGRASQAKDGKEETRRQGATTRKTTVCSVATRQPR